MGIGTKRDIRVEKPVKLIFVGGFLGSGKTTALAALAKRLLTQGKRVGIVTNDQSGNLADTVIVRELLSELGVAIEEVVAGCFCCKFDDLIDSMERILVHKPDVMMGEPVGSCTDFVAAVANPIKIHYHEAFHFAPFTTMVDPDRVRELLLAQKESIFPEEVAYLFGKQLEEADIVVLNKVDLISDQERQEIVSALQEKYPQKEILTTVARDDHGIDTWLNALLSGRPGANTILGQLDYDRYARAEAALGWLNAAIKINRTGPIAVHELLTDLMAGLQNDFRREKSEIGHLKAVFTCGGKSMWINLTSLDGEPLVSGMEVGEINRGTLILNARVQLDPERLQAITRKAIDKVAAACDITAEIDDLQCFSPAYPDPPYLVRETVEPQG